MCRIFKLSKFNSSYCVKIWKPKNVFTTRGVTFVCRLRVTCSRTSASWWSSSTRRRQTTPAPRCSMTRLRPVVLWPRRPADAVMSALLSGRCPLTRTMPPHRSHLHKYMSYLRDRVVSIPPYQVSTGTGFRRQQWASWMPILGLGVSGNELCDKLNITTFMNCRKSTISWYPECDT